jgi:1,4-dihydroxy-2-naphthoate polyprenyltransferase
MTTRATWLAAARPRTLAAAVVPVAVGTACAASAGGVAWAPALAALAGALAIQIGTNFANDVFDAERGADGPDRIGPVRAVGAGLVSAAAMKRAMVLAFAIAAGFGLYLATVGGWPIVVAGLLSIAAGIAYTGGPFPLGYHGLGDVCVLAFFGFVAVCGTALVQVGSVPAIAVWAALPVGALATAILVVNNLRDRTTDARVGKRTLAVRLGRAGAIAEYALLLAIAYAVPLALALAGRPWAVLPLATAPLAIVRVRALIRASSVSFGGIVARGRATSVDTASGAGAAFNRELAATAQLMTVHGAAFTVGLWLS